MAAVILAKLRYNLFTYRELDDELIARGRPPPCYGNRKIKVIALLKHDADVRHALETQEAAAKAQRRLTYERALTALTLDNEENKSICQKLAKEFRKTEDEFDRAVHLREEALELWEWFEEDLERLLEKYVDDDKDEEWKGYMRTFIADCQAYGERKREEGVKDPAAGKRERKREYVLYRKALKQE